MNNYFLEDGATLHKLKKEVEEKTYEVKSIISTSDIENIIISGIEGGINYWATIDNSTDAFKELKDSGLCLSQKVVEIVLNGGEVSIEDMEEGEDAKYKLTLERLLKGIELNMKNRKWDCDLENGDATTMDCIIQYAVFDDVIFG